jgi:tripartite-type tricarboxylate transporter receptor subunit TctC
MAEFPPGYEINSWSGVLGPAGIPAALVDRIADVGREAVESAEVRRRYEESGATVWWTPPPGLAAFRRENEARFAPLIQASGARVE